MPVVLSWYLGNGLAGLVIAFCALGGLVALASLIRKEARGRLKRFFWVIPLAILVYIVLNVHDAEDHHWTPESARSALFENEDTSSKRGASCEEYSILGREVEQAEGFVTEDGKRARGMVVCVIRRSHYEHPGAVVVFTSPPNHDH